MRELVLLSAAVALLLALQAVAWSKDTVQTTAEESQDADADKKLKGTGAGLALLGAGVAIGLGALGTGVAQSRIGSAGLGVIAEDPKKLGLVLMFIAIPETLLIFGFLIAIMLMGKT